MSFLELFKKKKSKDIAKDRLMMMLAYERATTKIENLDELKKELIEVVKKYPSIRGGGNRQLYQYGGPKIDVERFVKELK